MDKDSFLCSVVVDVIDNFDYMIGLNKSNYNIPNLYVLFLGVQP